MKFGFYEIEGDIIETFEAKTIEEAQGKLEKLQEQEDNDELKIVPMCPKCEKALFTVIFEEGGHLTVNEDGSYSDGGQTSGTYACSNCLKRIGGHGQNCWGFNPDLE